ncbi:uncharacterized protein SCHCODRAFT_02745706 [Schizophyllum commune H4-8]|uniref:MYND-type domain-containing protein n=1 Tax=Schizophyllum commune (strain H4-8 / FGSC 9210) TaxID=578458 RepID=D8PX74_SCHCM|nr:uncharacterized protein SCHCODRAFT_02745706 [Schizophyllum commune H4-8]KAI5896802.1 hypothetical protein SCHCODRAFT_02745706 [Schizophyllum commune H4-8]
MASRIVLPKKTLTGIRKAVEEQRNRPGMEANCPSFDRLEQVIAAGGDFTALVTDPFSIPSDDSQLLSPPIEAGLDAMTNLATVVWSLAYIPAHAYTKVVEVLRDNWLWLFSWIRFAHPDSQCIVFNNVFLGDYIAFLHNLLLLKKELSGAWKLTPQLYGLIMSLWLRMPSIWRALGSGSREDYEGTLMHMPWMITVAAAMQLISTSVSDTELSEGDDDYDRVAVREALETVGHRDGRVHRLVTRGAVYLLSAVEAAPTATTDDMAEALHVVHEQLVQLERFTMGMDLTEIRSRDVGSVVDLIRTLSAIAHGENAACTVVSILLGLCQWDQRAFVWALRYGAFPLVVSLWRADIVEEQRPVLAQFLWQTAAWTAYFPVAVAFNKHRESESFASPGLKDHPTFGKWWAIADEEVKKRCELVEELTTEKCHNYRCPGHDVKDVARFRRCQCFDVSYCSEPCQKQHWPLHKFMCTSSKRKPANTIGEKYFPIIFEDSGYITRRDAHFAGRLTREYLRQHGEEILAEIQDQDHPDVTPIREAAVFIDFHGLVRASHTIRMFPKELCCKNCLGKHLPIFVYAQLGRPQRGNAEASAIRVMTIVLHNFKLRVEHFRHCKDHSLCISRARDRPPRCHELEELREQCYCCVERFGKDEDPFSAPTAQELLCTAY